MKNFLACLAVVLMAATTASAQVNLLDDGSFDDASNGGNDPVTNSDWQIITINKPDGTNPSFKFNTGFANSENTLNGGLDGGTQNPGTGRGLWFRAFEGDQLDSDPNACAGDPNSSGCGGAGEPLAQAEVAQTIVAPKNGDYTLKFRAAKEEFFSAGTWDVTLSSDGTGGSDSIDLLTAPIDPLGNFNVNRGPSTQGGGDVFFLSLTGVTAGDNITVSARMIDGVDANINPQSGMVDRFLLQVPEPTSALLMGLASLGFVARRRR